MEPPLINYAGTCDKDKMIGLHPLNCLDYLVITEMEHPLISDPLEYRGGELLDVPVSEQWYELFLPTVDIFQERTLRLG